MKSIFMYALLTAALCLYCAPAQAVLPASAEPETTADEEELYKDFLPPKDDADKQEPADKEDEPADEEDEQVDEEDEQVDEEEKEPETIYGPAITDGLKVSLLISIADKLESARNLAPVLSELEKIADDDSDPDKAEEARRIIDHIHGWGQFALEEARENETSDLPAAVKQYRELAAKYEGMDVAVDAKQRLDDPAFSDEIKAWSLLAKVLKADEMLKSGNTGNVTPRQCMEVMAKATGMLKEQFPDTKSAAKAQGIAEGLKTWVTEQIEEAAELESTNPARAAAIYRDINATFGGETGQAAMARFQDPAFRRELEAWKEYTTKFLKAEQSLVTPEGREASVTDGNWERKNQFRLRIMKSTAVAIKKRYPDTAAWRKIEETLEDYDIEL